MARVRRVSRYSRAGPLACPVAVCALTNPPKSWSAETATLAAAASRRKRRLERWDINYLHHKLRPDLRANTKPEQDLKLPHRIAYCVYYQPVALARAFVSNFSPLSRDEHGCHVIPLPQLFNVATYFVDRNILEGRAQNVAIECRDERVTYQQLFERTNRAGNALRNLGVRPEERVLLLLLDSPEFLYSFFAAIKIGAVAVPVNTQAKPHEYEYILNDCRASVAVASESLAPQLQAIPRQKLPHLREIILVGDANSTGDRNPLRNLMQAASPKLEAEPTTKDDPAFWLYSS